MSSFYGQFNDPQLRGAYSQMGFQMPQMPRPYSTPPMPAGGMMGFSMNPPPSSVPGMVGYNQGSQGPVPYPNVPAGVNPEPTDSPGPGMAYDGPAPSAPPPPPPSSSSGSGGNQGINTGQNMSGTMALNPKDIDMSHFGGGLLSPGMQSAAVRMGMITPEQLRLFASVRNTGGAKGEFARQMRERFARIDARNRLRKRRRDAGFRIPRGQIIYD